MRSVATVAILALLGATGTAADARRTERCLLRVAVVQGNAAQATRAADGSYRGASVDIAKALARRWGRSATIVAMPPPQILAALERRELDLGFVAVNPDRGGAVAYSRPYMMVRQTVMVSAASPLRSVAELDRPGNSIGANTGDSVAGHLARTLKTARVVTSSDLSLGEAATWLANGTVSAFAGNRQRLSTAARTHGLRLLPDDLHAVPQGVAVARGDPAMLSAAQAALDDLALSGAVSRAIRRSRVVGVDPVPVQQRADDRSAAAPRCPA